MAHARKIETRVAALRAEHALERAAVRTAAISAAGARTALAVERERTESAARRPPRRAMNSPATLVAPARPSRRSSKVPRASSRQALAARLSASICNSMISRQRRVDTRGAAWGAALL